MPKLAKMRKIVKKKPCQLKMRCFIVISIKIRSNIWKYEKKTRQLHRKLPDMWCSIAISVESHFRSLFSNHMPTNFGKHSGDHNHQDFPKSIAIQIGGVLRYNWEAYCDTNGRSTDNIPFPQSAGAPKTLRYKWEAYCNTNGRCIAILF